MKTESIINHLKYLLEQEEMMQDTAKPKHEGGDGCWEHHERNKLYLEGAISKLKETI